MRVSPRVGVFRPIARSTTERDEILELLLAHDGVHLDYEDCIGVTYDDVTFPLGEGDVYVFYSDGVTEAMNAQGEEFSSERLMEVVSSARDEPASEIVNRVTLAVEQHRGGFPPSDDSTIVALRVT